jgi:hypothetical protein
MEKKIGFKDLSAPLKVAIVLLWVLIVLDALAFLIGFAAGVMSSI